MEATATTAMSYNWIKTASGGAASAPAFKLQARWPRHSNDSARSMALNSYACL